MSQKGDRHWRAMIYAIDMTTFNEADRFTSMRGL